VCVLHRPVSSPSGTCSKFTWCRGIHYVLNPVFTVRIRVHFWKSEGRLDLGQKRGGGQTLKSAEF
jgi:hypothetical protein